MVPMKTAKRDKTPPSTKSTNIHQFIISSPFPSLPFRKSTPSRTAHSFDPSFVLRYQFNLELSSNWSTSEQSPLPSILLLHFSYFKLPSHIPLQLPLAWPYLFTFEFLYLAVPSRICRFRSQKADRALISGHIFSLQFPFNFFRKRTRNFGLPRNLVT